MKKFIPSCIVIVLLCLSSHQLYSQNALQRQRGVAILNLMERNQEDSSRIFSVNQMAIVAGFPYIITNSIGEASTYGMIISSSDIYSTTFSNLEVDSIRNYISAGGVFITSNMRDYRMNDIFGISAFTTSRQNYTLNWNMNTNDSSLVWFDHPFEHEIILGRNTYSEVLFTRHYTLNGGTPLAFFNNDLNLPAVVYHPYINGHAYALGLSLRDVSLRCMLNYDYNSERNFSNAFEPNADVFLFFLRAVFAKHTPVMVWKHTSPANSYNTIMITHDIDSRTGMDTMLYFSEWEKNVGISASYNVTTRYLADSAMSAFYAGKESNVEAVKNDGHIINSHSVGHFYDFHHFTLGTSGMTMSNYHPFYNGDSTTGGFIIPELEVSKNILENNHNVTVRTFRAGHLRFPDQLANGLQLLNYEYESSMSSNDLGYSFPFPLKKDRSFSGETTNVYELSMTLSDVYDDGFNINDWPQKVQGWINDCIAYMNNNTPVNLLIHPNRTHKLAAEQIFLLNMGPKPKHLSMSAYGDFWRMREKAEFQSQLTGDTLIITLSNNTNTVDPWLSFMAEGYDIINTVLVQNSNGNPLNFVMEKYGENRMLIYNPNESVGIEPTAIAATESGFKVFPNPTNGAFTIQLKNQIQAVEVSVYDITGRIVHQEISNQEIINPDLQLKTGAYLIRLTSNNEVIGIETLIVR